MPPVWTRTRTCTSDHASRMPESSRPGTPPESRRSLAGLRFALTLSLAALLLPGCDPGMDTATRTEARKPAARRPIAGQQRRSHFYPRYQRWRIVQVKPHAGARLPIDLGGVPALLRGREVDLSAGYLTIPSPSVDGSQLSPVCYRWKGENLEAQFLDHREGAPKRRLTFRPAGEGRVVLELDGLFDLTLEPRPPRRDGGHERRQNDAFFNRRLTDFTPAEPRPGCELAEVRLPQLQHGPLELISPETGRRLVIRNGTLDLETPLALGSLSVEWRRALDPADSANAVGDCIGQLEVTRLSTGDAWEKRFQTEYVLFRKLFGEDSDGEMCGRMRLLRRISPGRILQLFDIQAFQHGGWDNPNIPMSLDEWLDARTFRSTIAGSVFQITILDEPRLLVNLIKRVDPPRSPKYQRPSRTAPAHFPADGPPDPRTPDVGVPPSMTPTIHRWVDEQGVVHYSDHPQR